MSKLYQAINQTIEVGKKFSNITVYDIEKDHTILGINFNQEMQYKIFSNYLNIHLNNAYNDRHEEYEDVQLTSDEFMLLFKGTVIGEVYLRKGFCHGMGSVSSATMVLKHLITVDLEKAKEAYAWARNFGFCNTYIPDPNDPHYIMHFSHKEDEVEQAAETVRELVEEKMLKEEKEKERQENDARRKEINERLKANDIKDRNLGLRESLIEKFNGLNIEEKLTRLANDTEHSPKFYPKKIIHEATAEDIRKLDIDTQKKLLKKFNMPLGKSPWKKFKKILISATENLDTDENYDE